MPREQSKPIQELIAENRKRFYRQIWKNYANIALYSDREDKMSEFLIDLDLIFRGIYKTSYKRELKVIYLAVEGFLKKWGEIGSNRWYDFYTGRAEIVQVCFELHKKYWDKFHKLFYGQWVKDAGGNIPTMNRTEALKEFLTMGFIYKTDIDFNPKDHYSIYSHIGGLWWPETFELHQDALNKMHDIGIPGLTGTTIPKT